MITVFLEKRKCGGWADPLKVLFFLFFCNRWNESQYFPSRSSKWIQKGPKNNITEHFNS